MTHQQLFQKYKMLTQCLTTCKTIPGKIWYGIDKLAEGVASFFGITDSRYEMYIDDSIEYLANVFKV